MQNLANSSEGVFYFKDMFKNKNKSLIIFSLTLVLCFLAIFSFTKYESKEIEKNISGAEDIKPPSLKEHADISFNFKIGEKVVRLQVSKNISLYEALVIAKKKGEINFSGKTYTGLGFFVTEIDSLRNGDGKYLFYYINGKEAPVGVSNYYPQNGDEVLWKLK
jgi:hypothetical protein